MISIKEVGAPVTEGVELTSVVQRVTFEDGRLSMWRDLRKRILPVAEKFIKKVESGKARSKETYSDMLEIRRMFEGGAADDTRSTTFVTSHHDENGEQTPTVS